MREFKTASAAKRASKAWRELIAATEAHAQRMGFEGRYFGPDEFRSFDIRLHGEPINRAYSNDVYWIESRQFHGSMESAPREYLVKARYEEDGSIMAVSEAFYTVEEALEALKFIAGRASC